MYENCFIVMQIKNNILEDIVCRFHSGKFDSISLYIFVGILSKFFFFSTLIGNSPIHHFNYHVCFLLHLPHISEVHRSPMIKLVSVLMKALSGAMKMHTENELMHLHFYKLFYLVSVRMMARSFASKELVHTSMIKEIF
jgi:hypothetical protein